MVALKGAKINDFVSNPSSDTKAVLIYGPDTGLVRERTNIIIKKIVGSTNDPFNVVKLNEDSLKNASTKLLDELLAMSLIGGERVILVQSPTTKTISTIIEYLNNQQKGNFLIVEAGELTPNLKLRKTFETHKLAVSLPCYNDDNRSISKLIDEELTKDNINITPNAKQYLATLIGGDRELSRSELEKLKLYCFDKGNIDIADIDAICGDASTLAIDNIINAVFSGNIALSDKYYSRLIQAGTSEHILIASLYKHINRLSTVINRPQNQNIDIAMSSLKPPIYFKHKEAFSKQVRKLTKEKINKIRQLIMEIEIKSRQNNMPVITLFNRTLFNIATIVK